MPRLYRDCDFSERVITERTLRKFSFFLLFVPNLAFASVFGVVKGIVHDPQHRPISGAQVIVKSATNDWRAETTTKDAGQFKLQTVPLGDYQLIVSARGFADQTLATTVTAGNAADLHFQLAIAKAQETVNVIAE